MMDDSVHDSFEFLHMEIVDYMLRAYTPERVALEKLEDLGFQVGQRLIEKATKDSPRFKDELEIVKFVCKEFWTSLYKKQVDHLRTNHQGVYVVVDDRFKLLQNVSTSKQYVDDIMKFLQFPAGIIRGALANLGLTCVVTAEVEECPQCRFQIQIRSY